MLRSHRFRQPSVVLFALLLVVALGGVAALAANGSVTYTYDALGRLTTAFYDTNVCITYGYDANGNRTSQSVLTSPGGRWGCFTWGQANWCATC